MTDMERRNFEDSFKNAFDGAEIAPSENVWTNIELELEKAEGGKIRRRLMFYKLLAAASVTFAMCVAGIGYYMVNKTNLNPANTIASTETTLKNEKTSEVESNSLNENKTQTEQERNESQKDQSDRSADLTQRTEPLADSQKNSLNPNIQGDGKRVEETQTTDRNFLKGDQPFVLQNNTGDATANVGFRNDSSESSSSDVLERSLPAFYNAKKPTLDAHIVKPDAGTLLLAKLADEERRYAKEDKKAEKNKSEKLWTSLGFAAGGFSSVNHSIATQPSSSAFLLANSTVPDKQSRASGVTYSYGVNVGTRISNRWIIQGGINYLTQSSDYTATNVVGDNNLQGLRAESINELDKISQLPQSLADNMANKLAPTVPYSVNNNVRFFSVPVQAGYLLINQKFSLQLNGGVSTDLFLENTITPEGGSLDKTTQGRGDDSPYRSVNFSGLMGTELSYKFGQRYRVALNPGVRYPLNSVYKSDVGIQSTPLTFDVGLRFRYIFR